MPKPIDHAQRKRKIVAESVKLFARYGYEAVNFGMIAQMGAVSRTLLYTYFKNKRAIFNEAIREVTSRVEMEYAEVVRSTQSADAKLRQICITVLAMLFDNRDFVCAITDVLASYRRKGEIPLEKIRRHTDGVKRIMTAFLGEAIHRGEYRKNIDPIRISELLYSQFETAAMRIAITGNAEISEAIDRMDSILFSLRQ
jgi:AcrR family transcriptional regulator